MNRREALRNVAILMGGAISVSTFSVISGGCKTNSKKSGQLFSTDHQLTIDELANTIIPTTDTPGAKAAGVGAFISMMITECYPETVQKMFADGLDDLDKKADSKFSGSFAGISAQQRASVLQDVVNELKKKKAEEADKAKAEKEKGDTTKKSQPAAKKDPEFFQLAKELTMLGYFTSEIGAKQALAYLPVPGTYESCIDMKAGQKAWAL